jgi:N-acetylmuramoyl-L-alanine amidase
MATIVLDPGHGGTTKVGGSSPNNATGPNGLKEKEVTLQVALAAEKELATDNIRVILTRRTDKNLGIADRANVARSNNADAFVSIHFNAPGGDVPAQGTETWIGEGHTPLSRSLAKVVQRRVVEATGYKDRGVKVGNVSGVIKPAAHSSRTANCLVEISFLSLDAKEEKRLRDPSYIDQLGEALARAVREDLQSRGLLLGPEVASEPEDAATYYQHMHANAERRSTASERDSSRDVRDGNAYRVLTGVRPIHDSIDPAKPFADIGRNAPVDDPEAMLAGWRKVRTEGLNLEAQVGRFLTLPAAMLALLGTRRRAVARIRTGGVDFRGNQGSWVGTGFLVAPNLFLTNHHVLNSVEVARRAELEFDFEVPEADLISGIAPPPTERQIFKADPDRLFVTSEVEGGLDFTFVWVDGAAAKDYGIIPMERASFTGKPGEQAIVIHHPGGQPKQVSLDDADIVGITATTVHYSSDTLGGSSGSPVFDAQGRLIALHHASVPQTVTLPDGQTSHVVNEGIKIGAIAVDLENRVRSRTGDAAMADEVLKAMKGSDSLTGFFGSLGRTSGSGTGVEAVVDAYSGTDQDIDIGFWNIEFLSNRWRDPQKLTGAARVIVDLNLDIWALSEVSPNAIEALIGELKDTFGETYEFALSEPDSGDGKQSTAVIWKTSQVQGTQVSWPADVERLFHLDSRDPQAADLEALHGKVFDRYPGLVRFETLGHRPSFDFYLVPLHLKAMSEGSLRRRYASRILVRAISRLMEETGEADMVLGGDVNAPLLSGDFDALTDANFTPMGAADEQSGGFSYLKRPRSLIDNIFLSPNLTKTAGGANYFIVAKERSIDDYVKRISDHRPVLLRLSLAAESTETGYSLTDEEIDAQIEGILRKEAPIRTTSRTSGKPRSKPRPVTGGSV